MMKRFYWLLYLLWGSLSAAAQTELIPTDEQSILNGEQLFADNCSRCHLFGEQKLGPSLSSITDKRTIEWLLAFITNSQGVIASGKDPYAEHLYRNYNQMVMPDFIALDDSEMLDILAYIKARSESDYQNLARDSINYFDQELADQAERRYSQPQPTEKNYYTMENGLEIVQMDVASVKRGRDLFEGHCQTCHLLDKRKMGPALASITDRLPIPWLLDFIKSPRDVMNTGDDYSNFLLTNYPLVMPDFRFLPDEDILDILAYIRYEAGAETSTAGVNATAELTDQEEDTTHELMDIETERSPQHEATPKELTPLSPFWKGVGIFFLVVMISLIIWLIFRIKL